MMGGFSYFRDVTYLEKMQSKYVIYLYTAVIFILFIVASIVMAINGRQIVPEENDWIGIVILVSTITVLVSFCLSKFKNKQPFKLSIKRASLVNFNATMLMYVFVTAFGRDNERFIYYKDLLSRVGFDTVAFILFAVTFITVLIDNISYQITNQRRKL